MKFITRLTVILLIGLSLTHSTSLQPAAPSYSQEDAKNFLDRVLIDYILQEARRREKLATDVQKTLYKANLQNYQNQRSSKHLSHKDPGVKSGVIFYVTLNNNKRRRI